MADKEPTAWVTVNGQHVPIFEGESKGDAINRAIAKSNSDTKSRQIANNQQQSNKAKQGQRPYKVNPKNLGLNDIKAEDANKTSDVLNLRNKQRFKFKDGTKITQVEAFAGKGCKREFRDAQKYADKYGKKDPKLAKASDWQHCSGKAVLTNGKYDIKREVHWVQGADGKMREAFIKEYPKKLKARK